MSKILKSIILVVLIPIIFQSCDLFPAESYQVTYDGNEASSGQPPVDDTEYLVGETVTVMANTRFLQKFHFRGWNTEPDYSGTHYLAGEQFSMPPSNVTLYAVWDVPSSVIYNSNQATSGTSPNDGDEYLFGEEVTVLGNSGNLERTGYTFIGWNTKDDGSGLGYSEGQTFDMPSSGVTLSSDTTLFAEWEIKTYDVTFNSDGGTEVPQQEIDHGATIDEPTIPTKQDYSFGGWFKEPELENPWNFDTETVTEDITLYAKWDSIYPDSFAVGSGTEEDPYQVETAGHLYIVRNHLDKHFIQTADIDLSFFSEGEGWAPIGTYFGDGFAGNAPFVGSFDGGGYTINNLVIDRGETNGVGLFGYTSGNATISDMTLKDIDILGMDSVGGLIGRNESSGDIINCSISGSIEGKDHNTGGLIGYNDNGDISDSYASGNVSGHYFTGGLIGDNDGGDISYSYANAEVSGNYATGGLVGRNFNGNITECFATGDVSGTRSYTGGLVAKNSHADICYSYAKGDVTGTGPVGGFVAVTSWSTDTIRHSYSAGAVTGGLGGFIGALSGSVENSFYDTETSGLLISVGGTPKTTEEMMQKTTFVDWDFTNVWDIDGGSSYPYLQWELD